MKKLILLMSLGLFVMLGCQKEETNPAQVNADGQKMYVLNADGNWQATPIREVQIKSEASATEKNNNSAHAHGNFTGFGGDLSVTFSGTENNGGAHGTAELTQILNLPFPPFNATAHIIMETACVTVIGNEALYRGIITETEGSPFPGGGPFALGNYFSFKVKDNGQGTNAATDQFDQGFSSSPNPNCDMGFTPGNYVDVEGASDMIKVN